MKRILIHPGGEIVIQSSPISENRNFTVSTGGTYIVQVFGRTDLTGSYTFRIINRDA